MRSGPRSGRGSASLFAVACLGVLVVVSLGLAAVGGLLVAHRTAQAAADLAALAAAGAAGRGEDPCARGTAIAAANGAALTGCSVSGREVRVQVVVAGPRWLGRRADLAAEARAGPP